MLISEGDLEDAGKGEDVQLKLNGVWLQGNEKAGTAGILQSYPVNERTVEKCFGDIGRPTAVEDGKEAGVPICTPLGSKALGERCDMATRTVGREASVDCSHPHLGEAHRGVKLAGGRGVVVGELLEKAAGKWSRQAYSYNAKVLGLSGFYSALGGCGGVKATPPWLPSGVGRHGHVRHSSASGMNAETWLHSYTDNALTPLTGALNVTVTGRAGGGSRRGPELRRLEGRSLLTVE
ncbi:ATPase family AAA domain-containing protein At1g05910 [Babesia caballi]|uniref:ATPase family AAA domain-containing protein At1g05910 n=1 Tax=Babesia caballi TaxID=5871 RepID=A0AAV4LYT7_BABCB|nr:ATPase family AAA domain-containing protein At1g05910 [Babesia caballi]